MRNYKQWTPKERMDSYKLTKKAIANGVIPPATVCNRCGQDKGIVMYHNEDYSDPIKYLESLCWRCHQIHHSEHINKEACDKYWEEIRNGKKYAPIYSYRAFGILAKENGIVKVKNNK